MDRETRRPTLIVRRETWQTIAAQKATKRKTSHGGLYTCLRQISSTVSAIHYFKSYFLIETVPSAMIIPPCC